MFSRQDDLNTVIYTVTEIAKAEKLNEIVDLIAQSQNSIEQTGYDNWNGGIYFYTLYFAVDIELFVKIRDRVQNIETTILEKINLTTRQIENEEISRVLIIPKAQIKID